MKNRLILFAVVSVVLASSGCAPFDKIYSHDFGAGYFRLKSPGNAPKKVYLENSGDTINIYDVKKEEGKNKPDLPTLKKILPSSVIPGGYLYNSTFVKTSADFDLSTMLLKYRMHAGDIEPQLSTNVNGLLYLGFRKDFFRITSHLSPAGHRNTFIRHTAFDLGPFAGIGITPVNPTVTMFRTQQEYDGIVLQKGFAVFGTFENMSVGLAIGWDNLLDKNRRIWVYNNKPYFGLVIGIANF